MDDPISENGEVLEGSVASAAAGGSGAHRSYGSTVAKLVQPMESKTPGSARNAQESDERWPALNAQNLSYTLKVNEVKVWSGLKHLGAEYLPGGGFGADFTQNSLRPDLLPRTGIKMGETKFLAAPCESGLCDRRDVEEQTSFPTRSQDGFRRNWHCKHYTGRGVMKFNESGAALAQDMGVSISKIEESSLKIAQDPDGGPYSAYPSLGTKGRSSTTMLFREPILPHSPTPVIHYCMGGLEIDENSAVLAADSKPFPGLYAGEVAGGVHDNRVGGNSLLDYVVFGRVAGAACAKYVLGDRVKATSLAALADVEGSKSDQAIVVGGGLAKNGGSVVLLDKSSFDGINGARTQREKDSAVSSDTLKGGAKKPELAKLRKLSSFLCAKRCKSRTLRSAAKRELRGVTLLTSVHSCGCPLGLAAHEVAAA